MKKILLIGEKDVNCYIIEDKGKCYIVDPGYEKEKIIDYIEEKKLEVLGILLTHAHVNHIWSIGEFNVPVYLHRREYEILVNNYKAGLSYLGEKLPFDVEKLRITLIRDKSTIQLNEKRIVAIHTPGHTVGGVCYEFGNDLFTGDTLYKSSVGRWDLATGDLESLKKSVTHLIDGHADHFKVHPAHGESSTIGEEKMNNSMYLRWKKQ